MSCTSGRKRSRCSKRSVTAANDASLSDEAEEEPQACFLHEAWSDESGSCSEEGVEFILARERERGLTTEHVYAEYQTLTFQTVQSLDKRDVFTELRKPCSTADSFLPGLGLTMGEIAYISIPQSGVRGKARDARNRETKRKKAP